MNDNEYRFDLSLYYEAVADRYLRQREVQDAEARFDLADRRVKEAVAQLTLALENAQDYVAARATSNAHAMINS